MKKNSIATLDSLLEEITPEEQMRTDAKMQLAAKIADAMIEKGWNNNMLMKAMGKKNPSEITRWLSGTHNFTVDTLIDLGHVLDTDFLNVGETEFTDKHFEINIYAYSSNYAEKSMVNEPSTEWTISENTYLLNNHGAGRY